MIITIEMTIDQISSLPREGVEQLIIEMSRSSRHGNNFIVLRPDIISWSIDNFQFSAMELAHLENLREKYPTISGILKSRATYLSIEITDKNILKVSPTKWVAGYKYVLDFNLLDKPNLLCENANVDGIFYLEIFKLCARTFSINEISFNIVNGGGTGIISEYKRLADKNQITICIVDSDKISPYSDESATTTKLKKINKDLFFISHVFETPCCELENFIPLSIVHKSNNYRNASQIHTMKKVLDSQGPTQPGDCAWLYFDMKKGLYTKSNTFIKQNDESKKWIKRKYNVVSSDRDLSLEIPGFGENIINVIYDDGAAMSEFSKFTTKPYWKEHFLPWISEIIWYFASSKKKIAF